MQTGPYKNAEASRRRAFTLIELILVMTILTVVIALAAPSLANFFRGRTLDSEARRLLALTRHGQSRAVSEGMPMELWVDRERRTFGLEAETSYNNDDSKALDFTLDEGVQIEVIKIDPTNPSDPVNNARYTSALNTASLVDVASLPPIVTKHPDLPRIRFLPDGSTSESSPQVLRLLDRDGVSLWLALARNRVTYEIRTQSNSASRQ